MTTYRISNVQAVLPDRVLPRATVTVSEGVIVEVDERFDEQANIDGGGHHLLPGLIDTHSDGLEKELIPRPGVELPLDFGLLSFESRVRGAGITTIFHGVAFENSASGNRTVERAIAASRAIGSRAASVATPIDHRILYRLDVRSAEGFEALKTAVPLDSDPPALVSYEDHTPGRGQYADRRWFERYVAGTKGVSEAEAQQVIDDLIHVREGKAANIDAAMPWLAEQALAGRIRLMCHDPAVDSELDDALTVGTAIAEFPTTLAAARHARALNLPIVAGGPNVLRGESHSGNVSARDLIAADLCDVISSDYLPTSLIGSVSTLVNRGICELVDAVALVTSGPADAVGLTDRGRIAVGQRADLCLVDLSDTWPTVLHTITPTLGVHAPTTQQHRTVMT